MLELTVAEITPEDIRNGWDRHSLASYHEEREAAAGLVAGNIVTAWDRPRPAIRVENCLKSDPHKYWR